MIYLKEISIEHKKNTDTKTYPFSIPAIRSFSTMEITSDVTFFTGENGSGKSTLMEALAISIGFNPLGGNKNHMYESTQTESSLHTDLRLAWLPKTNRGFFLRAESFFHFASALDTLEMEDSTGFRGYGGDSLHAMSHGESFFSLFMHKFRDGFFLMDEPESALSPMKQLSLMRIIRDKLPKAQFLIATHSPILLAYPKAQILHFGECGVEEKQYDDLANVQLYRNFLERPERYLEHLFSND